MPKKLPRTGFAWERLIPEIGAANRALARYDGVLQGVPNPEILLSPLTTQEAVLSSRIEGTRATLDEVLKFEAERKYTRKKDVWTSRKSSTIAVPSTRRRQPYIGDPSTSTCSVGSMASCSTAFEGETRGEEDSAPSRTTLPHRGSVSSRPCSSRPNRIR